MSLTFYPDITYYEAKNIGLVVLNTVTLIIMLFANYASNAGIFSKVSVADISHAPAGYAFVIWFFYFH